MAENVFEVEVRNTFLHFSAPSSQDGARRSKSAPARMYLETIRVKFVPKRPNDAVIHMENALETLPDVQDARRFPRGAHMEHGYLGLFAIQVKFSTVHAARDTCSFINQRAFAFLQGGPSNESYYLNRSLGILTASRDPQVSIALREVVFVQRGAFVLDVNLVSTNGPFKVTSLVAERSELSVWRLHRAATSDSFIDFVRFRSQPGIEGSRSAKVLILSIGQSVPAASEVAFIKGLLGDAACKVAHTVEVAAERLAEDAPFELFQVVGLASPTGFITNEHLDVPNEAILKMLKRFSGRFVFLSCCLKGDDKFFSWQLLQQVPTIDVVMGWSGKPSHHTCLRAAQRLWNLIVGDDELAPPEAWKRIRDEWPSHDSCRPTLAFRPAMKPLASTDKYAFCAGAGFVGAISLATVLGFAKDTISADDMNRMLKCPPGTCLCAKYIVSTNPVDWDTYWASTNLTCQRWVGLGVSIVFSVMFVVVAIVVAHDCRKLQRWTAITGHIMYAAFSRFLMVVPAVLLAPAPGPCFWSSLLFTTGNSCLCAPCLWLLLLTRKVAELGTNCGRPAAVRQHCSFCVGWNGCSILVWMILALFKSEGKRVLQQQGLYIFLIYNAVDVCLLWRSVEKIRELGNSDASILLRCKCLLASQVVWALSFGLWLTLGGLHALQYYSFWQVLLNRLLEVLKMVLLHRLSLELDLPPPAPSC